jgi:hypothetical protein
MSYEIFEALQKFSWIKFVDDTHTYLMDGDIKATSVTGLIKKCEPPFEEAKIAAAVARKEGRTVAEVINEWHYKRDLSVEKGKSVHSFIEDYLVNKVAPYPVERIRLAMSKYSPDKDPVFDPYRKCIRHAKTFCDNIAGKMIPIGSEVVVGKRDWNLCGMIDQIFYNKKSGKLELWDWKTNKEIATTSKYSMIGPVAHLEKCELNTYSLQLGIYKRLISEETGLEFGDSYICWFNENEPTYKIFKCHEFKDEIEAVIQMQIAAISR